MLIMLGLSLLWVMIVLLGLVQLFLSEMEILMDCQIESIESGFEKIGTALFISSTFIFLGVLYVLFDMELIFLLPIVLQNNNHYSLMIISMLMIIIMITLLVEWAWYGLKWSF